MAAHASELDNLLQVTEFTEHELPFTTLEEANRLSNLLKVQKKLPSFYFAQAADELTIPSHVYKQCRRSWDLHPVEDESKVKDTLRILNQVVKRLALYKSGLETYPQAMFRLKKRVNQLARSGISYNRIANYLHISFRTLSDISKLTYNERQRPRHCPWEMLKKLQNAENDIPKFNHSHILSRGAPRGRKAAHEKLDLNSAPDPANFTTLNGNCVKCNASWPNLYADGQDPHGNFIYICRLCSKSNLVQDTPLEPIPRGKKSPVPSQPPPHQPSLPPTAPPPSPYDAKRYVVRYTRCWNCSSPWHNVLKDSKDENGYTTYICIICTETNIVPPRLLRSKTTLRS